jgi:type I restriction enzyme R subunit
MDVEEFNRTVRTENFNRAVCGELARRLDPDGPGKTLVFCVDDSHADLVVRLLKDAFADVYGEVEDDAVVKITGSVDKPPEAVRRFKNERYPTVAVTVDLLTTGVDVPEIVHLVFLRRVRSRILYEQMMGRATRLCEDLGNGEEKEVFEIYDAVRLYEALQDHTDMKPVVASLKTTFNDLVRDLVALDDDDHRALVRDQLTAKLRRKRKKILALADDPFRAAAGLGVDELLDKLAHEPLGELLKYFRKHLDLGETLDRLLPTESPDVIISRHEDEVVAVTQGYGKNNLPPEDYLEEFTRFVRESGNEIPALLVVQQRPRDLTRQELKELKLALDLEGYGEADLRAAWTAAKNEDIAASIIGFIRQRALGDPLLPYEQRVDDAVRRILRRTEWTPPQRRWIQRIAQQMKKETVVDRAALDRGVFRADGGFQRIDRIFGGHAADVLAELHEEVWKESA